MYFAIRDDCFSITTDKVFRISLSSEMCLRIWRLRLFNLSDNVCIMFIFVFVFISVKNFLNVYESRNIFLNFTYLVREHFVLLHKSFNIKCNDDDIFFLFSSILSSHMMRFEMMILALNLRNSILTLSLRESTRKHETWKQKWWEWKIDCRRFRFRDRHNNRSM